MSDTPTPLPTSDEITRRLRIVAELRNLCLSLGRVRPMEPAVEPVPGEAPPAPTPSIAPETPIR